MSGQAIVTIGESQWSATIASTVAELLAGLSGIASMPDNTGMLFDLGSDQDSISVNTSEMIFSLDIIFISEAENVVGVLHDIVPGDSASFERDSLPGARYFLEVNAGEASGVEVGDSVDIQGGAEQPSQFELGTIVELMVTMMIVVMMMKMMTRSFAPAKERPLIYGPKGELLTGK